VNHSADNEISIDRAVWIGTAWVNLPVLACFVFGYGGLILAARAFHISFYLDEMFEFVRKHLGTFGSVVVTVVFLVGPFVAAWTWWSFNVPKWRLWAMARTEDWDELERRAIEAGLIWDETTTMGRLFSRTEIWSKGDRELLRHLEKSHGPSNL